MALKQSRVWRIPGLLIWTAAAALLAGLLSSKAGVLAAIAGVALAFEAYERLQDRGVRLPRLWALGLGSAALAYLLHEFLPYSSGLAKLIGSSGVYTLAEGIFWFALPAALLTPLLLSARTSAFFLTLEGGALIAIFAGMLAAHRDGSLHRPFLITDWLLERNYDPMPFFLGVGALLGITLVFWLLSRRAQKRSIFDPLMLVAAIVALFLFLPDGRLRQLAVFAGGGGQDDKTKQQQGGGSKKDGAKDDGKEQQKDRNLDPNPTNGSGQKSFPVAVVNLHDDYNPPYGTYYFRQDALSYYNGRRLVRDASGKEDIDVGMTFPSETITVPLREHAEQAVKGQKPAAKRLRTTVALMAPHSRPFGMIDSAKFSPAPNPDPKRFERAYNVESIVLEKDFGDLLTRELGSASWTPQDWAYYTKPPEDPRYQGIVEEAKKLLPAHLRPIPLAQALAVKFWMDKNTTYNLNVANADDESDPVAKFLFGDRNGYCVQLAHSAVYLFRTLGIPSRVSVGYAVSARQRGEGSTVLIRNGDAHAWPEVYVRGLGWVVLDITPEKVVTPPDEKPDPELQKMLGEMARQTPGSPKEEYPPAGDGDLRKAFLEALQALGKLMVPLLLMTLFALYIMKAWRRFEPRFCKEARLPVVAYRSSLDRLAELGLVRERGVTRESFAQRLADRCPRLSDLTGLHLSEAFGLERPRESRRRYLDLNREISRDAARNLPWWRRMLGAIHPLAWWKVN